ncbi:MAG: glycosyltransferase family 9 protein [Verrucomicrobiales bacterium]|nr:hypothetical protein [Verrucomicrobiales bacterium]MDF1785851.1 glycosyltransferase family 9 protein [Verrucomicrobiales bacterium]
MIALLFIKLIGRVLASMPMSFVACFAQMIGRAIYKLPIARMRAMRSNLHHAFPDKDSDWRARVGKLTSVYLIEMATFALASPFLSRRWFEENLTMTDDVRERLRSGAMGGGINLMPHMTYFEMTGAVPALIPEAVGHPSIFRPLKQPAISDWVKSTRERWGLRMLSRKEGMRPIMKAVRDGKCLTVLFDQNAGSSGTLIYFMGRVASATHLPGLLAKKFDVPVYLLMPRRVGFWRVELDFEKLPKSESPEAVMLTSHARLEAYLDGAPEQVADWLWFHNRWSTHGKPRQRFQLRETGRYLDESIEFQGHSEWPKRNRLWFRLPNWLGDVVMALPLIRAVREARPDAEITLIASSGMRPLLERIDVADRLIDLPRKKLSSWSYFREVARWRHEYPDCYLCFTNSTRGDIEAFLAGSPVRLGMVRPGKRRSLLTKPWPLPVGLDEAQCHQLDLWEQMFRSYGLLGDLDRKPLSRETCGGGIGLICGTENNPEKRWPVEHWRALIERILKETDEIIYLYGTPLDRRITDQVGAEFDSDRVLNLAGETDLAEFLDHLTARRGVFCNDTGGMHLANMLGVPIFAIFGPTNPIRTGPVFEGTAQVVQPEGCPRMGGMGISEVSVDQVWSAWSDAQL